MCLFTPDAPVMKVKERFPEISSLDTPSVPYYIRVTMNQRIDAVKMKEIEKAVHDKQVDKLPEMLKGVYSIIDTASKKNLIKKNNAARKKARMARIVNEALTGK